MISLYSGSFVLRKGIAYFISRVSLRRWSIFHLLSRVSARTKGVEYGEKLPLFTELKALAPLVAVALKSKSFPEF
jgi:hypothetical protein